MSGIPEKLDVVLASMPFAPVHMPTIGIELLKAAVPDRRVRTIYFTVEYVRRFGPLLYRTVVDRHSTLIGEWIFSPALFDTNPADDEPFLGQLVRDPERGLDAAQVELCAPPGSAPPRSSTHAWTRCCRTTRPSSA